MPLWPLLVTHSGTVHLDDAFAYAVLLLALGLREPGRDTAAPRASGRVRERRQERPRPGHVWVVRTSLPSRGVAMPGPRSEKRVRAAPRPPPDGGADRVPNGAPRAGFGPPRSGPKPAFRDLLRGLRAGDLESVLLTVAIAAEENRMPSADPDEARRILAFLARLAEHDAGLPPPQDG